MLTYSLLLLLQLLVAAEARRDNAAQPQEVRDRSSETVSLCKQRMAQEGLTRSRLEELAGEEAAARRRCAC